MYCEALKDVVLSDRRFIILTAENLASIRPVVEGLGHQFVDLGICEQTLVGAAAGLALRGRIPVVHAIAAFLSMRAFEFIRTDIGIPDLPVKLAAGIPGFLSEANGSTHQAIEDIALMRVIPNMCIFCPADEEDLVIGLKTVLEFPHPFYIRLNHSRPSVTHARSFSVGKAEIVKDGGDVSLLTFGVLFEEALRATQVLAALGISVRLVNLRTLNPIDRQVIVSAAEQTRLVVTLEDHSIRGGLFSIVSELLLRERVAGRILPVALEKSHFRPCPYEDVLEYEKFTALSLAERILKELDGGRDDAQ